MAQRALFDQVYDVRAPSGVAVRGRVASGILAKATGAIEGFCDYSLNPYVGCAFGCAYCYAAFFVPDEAQARDWGNWVDIKVNALALLKRRTTDVAGKRILIGSATDPYQPLEQRVRLTRAILNLLAGVRPQPNVHVQTRSPFVEQDIELFQKFDHLTVGISVTTDDESVSRRFEPRCAPIERRLQAAERLAKAGVKVILSLAPLLPVRDPARFADRLGQVGASAIWTSFFRTGQGEFRAGTRPLALSLAREMGWTERRYRETVEELRKHLPLLRG